MGVEYHEFTEDMLPEAAALLADRHAANRREIPLLPSRFGDASEAEKAVRSLWQHKGREGFAAFSNGRMTGYLLGEVIAQDWGRCGYVYLPGHALAREESPFILQDLYGKLGERWVQRGAFNHYLYLCSVDRRAIDSFFEIGFGKERIDALLELERLEIPEVTPPDGVSVRRAGPDDSTRLGGLSPSIMKALSEPPYWHPTTPELLAELHEGWSELAADKEWIIWIALQGDQTLGMIGFRPETEQDDHMLIGPQTVYLSLAATLPEARRRGISTYLTWQGLRHVRQQGFRICFTDWVSANLWAARHWPRYGFMPAAYRLAKRVLPDILWTRRFFASNNPA